MKTINYLRVLLMYAHPDICFILNFPSNTHMYTHSFPERLTLETINWQAKTAYLLLKIVKNHPGHRGPNCPRKLWQSKNFCDPCPFPRFLLPTLQHTSTYQLPSDITGFHTFSLLLFFKRTLSRNYKLFLFDLVCHKNFCDKGFRGLCVRRK